MAKVTITPTAAAQVANLPYDIQLRIAKVIDRLARWPAVSGAKPLRGDLAGQFRIRTGDYRVQFTASGTGGAAVVVIIKAGHRDGFYDE